MGSRRPSLSRRLPTSPFTAAGPRRCPPSRSLKKPSNRSPDPTGKPRRSRMKIQRNGSTPSKNGSAEYFTGAVRVDTAFKADEPGRVEGAYVTFEPGARTAWHTHPLGQTLIVTAGCGRAQRWDGPIEEKIGRASCRERV